MMNFLSCTETRSHVPLFVGGDLEEPAAGRVQVHLKGCPACADHLAAATAARSALRALALEPGDEPGNEAETVDLWPLVRNRLRSEGLLTEASGSPSSADPRRRRRGAAWGSSRRFARYAVAAALLAALLFTIRLGGDSAPPDQLGQLGQLGTAGEPGAADVSGGVPAVTPVVELTPADLLLAPSPGLRRFQPGDERLWDGAVPFPGGRPGHFHPTPQQPRNVLVGFDEGVR